MRRFVGWVALGCLGAMGCGGAPSPEESVTNASQSERAEAQSLNNPSPDADNDYHTLSGRELMKATASQLDLFQHACLDGDGWLKYECGNKYDGGSLSAQHKIRVGDRTRVSDNGGHYAGECVSFVRVESNRDLGTGYYHKGDKVTNGHTPAGAVISLFNGDKYNGHVAFFLGYDKDTKGKIKGIHVMDQNWEGSGLVRKHSFSSGGSGQADADNYYEVEVDK